MAISSIVINKGAYVSILSSTAWEDLGSPQLVPVTQNLLAFNRGTSQPLGILPKFPITLGGKFVYIDKMVVQGPLDINLLLGHDYFYVMGSLVSSLFRVMCFPHRGSIVIIDQVTFIGLESTPNQPSSLSGSYLKVVSPSPQVNYVATCSVPTSTNDLLSDVVCHVLGDWSPIFHLDPWTCIPSRVLLSHLMRTSWKPWSLIVHDQGHKDNSFTMSNLLKNEIGATRIVFLLCQSR